MVELYITDILLYFTANYAVTDGQALFYLNALQTQNTRKVLVSVTQARYEYEYHHVRVSRPSLRM